MKASSDNMHDKYKDLDLTDAKPVSETPHLAKLQAEAGGQTKRKRQGALKMKTMNKNR